MDMQFSQAGVQQADGVTVTSGVHVGLEGSHGEQDMPSTAMDNILPSGGWVVYSCIIDDFDQTGSTTLKGHPWSSTLQDDFEILF